MILLLLFAYFPILNGEKLYWSFVKEGIYIIPGALYYQTCFIVVFSSCRSARKAQECETAWMIAGCSRSSSSQEIRPARME